MKVNVEQCCRLPCSRGSSVEWRTCASHAQAPQFSTHGSDEGCEFILMACEQQMDISFLYSSNWIVQKLVPYKQLTLYKSNRDF